MSKTASTPWRTHISEQSILATGVKQALYHYAKESLDECDISSPENKL